MSSVAGLRPLEAPASCTHSALEAINLFPTPKYVIPPSTPANFSEHGCGVHSRLRFRLPVRVADSTAEAEKLDCLYYMWGR